jgi:hypothetical protein
MICRFSLPVCTHAHSWPVCRLASRLDARGEAKVPSIFVLRGGMRRFKQVHDVTLVALLLLEQTAVLCMSVLCRSIALYLHSISGVMALLNKGILFGGTGLCWRDGHSQG